MIEVRVKGGPLTKALRVDEEGFACFTLDETKFNPFEVMLTTMRKCGYVDPPGDPKLDRVLAKRERTNAEALAAARR